jgi:SRSO17 transposase
MKIEYKYNKTPLVGSLEDFSEKVYLHKVDETKWESVWDDMVKEHHYLGYESVIGGRVKYLISLDKRLIGAISFCSGCYKLGPRDLYIGWDEKSRLDLLQHVVTNNRFLILPWVKIKNLASHILAVSLKKLKVDWERQYEIEPYMVETFVEPGKYLGTCYKASNWTYLGMTKGFGRVGNSFVFHGQVKDIYVIILNKEFYDLFRPDVKRLPNVKDEILGVISRIPIYYEKVLEHAGLTGLSETTVNEELADYLARYIHYLNRIELIEHFVAMVKGLLSDLERKTGDNIAAAYEGCSQARNFLNFLSRSTWDQAGMLDEYQNELSELLVHSDGMITGDCCCFLKKGTHSVGVARQPYGLDKPDNCQIGVMLGYVSPEGYGILDYELFMPEVWFEESHKKFLKECRVPNDVEFKTKNQLLSEMINKIFCSEGFKGKYIGLDLTFGQDQRFLASLPKEMIYFAEIPEDTLVYVSDENVLKIMNEDRRKKASEPVSDSTPIPVRMLANNKILAWETVVLGHNAKGSITAKDKCLPVVEVVDNQPGSALWLYLRRLEDDSIKYALCNASMEASIEDIRKPASMRWTIEECFKECREYLGLDHYEYRTWLAWRRHMLLSFLSHFFVTKLQRKFEVTKDSNGNVTVVVRPAALEEEELKFADDLLVNTRPIKPQPPKPLQINYEIPKIINNDSRV